MKTQRQEGVGIKRAPRSSCRMHIRVVRSEPEGFAPEPAFVCIYESARVEIP